MQLDIERVKSFFNFDSLPDDPLEPMDILEGYDLPYIELPPELPLQFEYDDDDENDPNVGNLQ
jgi:hypothetical protein